MILVPKPLLGQGKMAASCLDTAKISDFKVVSDH